LPPGLSEFEILFAVSDAADPAYSGAEIDSGFSRPAIRIIVWKKKDRPGRTARCRIFAAWCARRGDDLLVITDSDVRVEPGYLRSVARCSAIRKSAADALYRGIDNLQFVAAMDCVGSSVRFAARRWWRANSKASNHDGFDDGHNETPPGRNWRLRADGRPAFGRLRIGPRITEPATASNCCRAGLDGNFPHKR